MFKKYYGLCIILIICIVNIIYSIRINNKYYQAYSPFYDSLSYSLSYAKVDHIIQQKGIIAGIVEASHSINGFLPITIAAITSFFFGLSRAWGVIGNAWLMFLCCFSIYYYLRKIRKCPQVYSAVVAGLLVSIKLVYFCRGGLPDFRMDLSLYYGFGCCSVCYLITCYNNSKKYWVVFAVAVSLTMLTRSTSFVYLGIALGPLLLIRMFAELSEERIKTIKGIGIFCLVIVLLSGWFYILNYKNIIYYYLSWNVDALTHLPLSESIRHITLMTGNVGLYSWIIAGILLVLRILNFRSIDRNDNNTNLLKIILTQLDWRCLSAGVLVILFFIFKGVGLNPYISLPSAFGFLAFLCFPGKKNNEFDNKHLIYSILEISCLCAVLIININEGNQAFLTLDNSERGSIKTYQKIAEELTRDAQDLSLSTLSIDCPSCGVFIIDALYNVLVFNNGFQILDDNNLIKNNLIIKKPSEKILATCPQEWKEFVDKSAGFPISYIGKQAQQLNILIMPTKETITVLQRKYKHIPSNNYLTEISLAIFENNQWEKTSKKFDVTQDEQYELYIKK